MEATMWLQDCLQAAVPLTGVLMLAPARSPLIMLVAATALALMVYDGVELLHRLQSVGGVSRIVQLMATQTATGGPTHAPTLMEREVLTFLARTGGR